MSGPRWAQRDGEVVLVEAGSSRERWRRWEAEHGRGLGDDAFIHHPEHFDQATSDRELARLADETQSDLDDLHRGVGPGGLTDTQDQRAGELDRRLEDIAAARRRNLAR